MKEHMLATRVGHSIYNSVQTITEAIDISVSEYLRKLILSDLDSKILIDEELRLAFLKAIKDRKSHERTE